MYKCSLCWQPKRIWVKFYSFIPRVLTVLGHVLGAADTAVKKDKNNCPSWSLQNGLLYKRADRFFCTHCLTSQPVLASNFSKAETPPQKISSGSTGNYAWWAIRKEGQCDGPLKRRAQILLCCVKGAMDLLVMRTNKPMFSFTDKPVWQIKCTQSTFPSHLGAKEHSKALLLKKKGHKRGPVLILSVLTTKSINQSITMGGDECVN